MSSERETTLIVEYRCPRCDAALEARPSQAYGWIRCPRCGRAALPPESSRMPRSSFHVPPGGEALIRSPDPRVDASPRQPTGRVRRILGAAGCFLSLLLALFAQLERSRFAASAFILVALGCLAFAVSRRHW